MKIAGLQKTTLVDYPGILASTIFTPGCNFRCPFCHNPELVLPTKYQANIPESEFFDFLTSRIGKIQGVCLTGGEPLLQPKIEKFISHIKALGFKVKLDTNGSFSEKLEEIIKEGDIDYIAMDIKHSKQKYFSAIGIQKNNLLLRNIEKSIDLIKNSKIDYEFRTTVVKPIHHPDDFAAIGQLINKAKKYYI